MKFTDLYMEALISEDVNIDAIEYIESSKKPKAIGRTGARGAMQILNKKTWDAITKDMGQSWSWDKDWSNRQINRAVGNHYINVIIPRYLKAYKLPDTPETRIAVYNWGIGNFKKAYRKYKDNWKDVAPIETTKYLYKYAKYTAAPTTSPIAIKPTVPSIAPATSIAKQEQQKTPETGVHVVKNGDTISGILKKYNIELEDFKTFNPDIKDINKIHVGDKIKIA